MEKQSHISKILTVLRNRTLHEVVVIVLGVGAIVGYGEYRRYDVVQDLRGVDQKLTIEKEGLEQRIGQNESELSLLKDETTKIIKLLQSELQNEQTKSATFEQEITKIAGTVGTLDKLSKTDEELLQKYSKAYFLNEHYVPVELANINETYATRADAVFQIHANVLPFLNRMLIDTTNANLRLKVGSAYRSFGTQAVLKSTYRFNYGAGTANQFSAEQGYSEHQLGTTVDLLTPETATSFTGFDQTPEYTWLVENAYKYGFILSYPKGNTYYQYEPWHWRFVGVALATRLHNEGRYFYDFDQREINTYLANIFD